MMMLSPDRFSSHGRTLPISLVLATRNLFRDRVRLVATLIGIVFSVVLVTVDLGLFVGFQRTVTVMIEHAGADIWIGPAETKSFEATSFLEGRERFRALPIYGVTQVAPIMVSFGYWRKPDGSSRVPVFLVGIDPVSDTLKPWNIVAGTLEDMESPDAVAADATYFDRLGVTRGRLWGDRRPQGARRRGNEGHSLVCHDAIHLRAHRPSAGLDGRATRRGDVFFGARRAGCRCRLDPAPARCRSP
jgi:hypothetical protein